MKRQRSQSTQKRDQELLSLILPIKTDHPLWGYRRIWAYLKYRQGHVIGINRVHRVMKEHNLLVTPQQRLRARRGPTRPKPRSHQPNHIWGIDMTKIKIAHLGMALPDRGPRLVHQRNRRLLAQHSVQNR